MPTSTNDKELYWRASIAIRFERKPILMERMKQLGLKTTGDLVNLLVLADEEIIEALKPFADKFVSYRDRIKNPNPKKDLLAQFKALDPTTMAELLAQHKVKLEAEQKVQ